MSAYTQGDLTVETSFPILDIGKFKLNVQPGAHGRMEVEGDIPEEVGKSILFQNLNGNAVKARIGNRTIFSGQIESAQILHEGGSYHVTLHGVSFTALLDSAKKSRTFQDTSAAYKKIMGEILQSMPGSGMQFHAEDKSIEFPLYQLEETDWEFLRRMASHLHTDLIPDTIRNSPHIFVGLPEGKMQDTKDAGVVCEKVWMDKRNKSMCRSIRSYADWDIGEQVRLEDSIYSIVEKSCQLEEGLLVFRYSVSSKKAVVRDRFENENHGGRLLSAKVLDVRDEEVKVKFDIDADQPKEGAFWYPFSPEAGNVMYCMPKAGEPVYIRLEDSTGKRAQAVYGVHTNGPGNPEMKPEDRYFTTDNLKRMYFTKDAMGFRDLKKDSPLEITLNDSAGANAVSNKNIVVFARDVIGIKGKNVIFQAPKEISIVRKDNLSPTVINMCNGFDSIGATNEVKTSGDSGTNFPVFHEDQQKQEKYGLQGVEKNIIASTPSKKLSGDFGQKMRGIKVDFVPGEE